MAFELGKLKKFAPLVGVYAFYNVFATNYPADPVGGMRTALTDFMTDPLGKLQSKMTNITNLAIVVIGAPIVLKMFKLPASVKMIANIAVYYFVGDQAAAVLNGSGRFGAVGGYIMPGRARTTWGGETSAFKQYTPASGTVKNIYSE
jgi:hypothetical protein